MQNIKDIDWRNVQDALDLQGFARIPRVLSAEECASIIKLYGHNDHFRSTINMARYRFGYGEYKYFDYPLPQIVQDLREQLYPGLVPVANEWMERLRLAINYPAGLQEFLARCHSQGQRRATPLVLRYEAGGYNTLHQDIYGEIFFPFQVVIMLTQTGIDYNGGELVFIEQVPRAQSRAEVINPSIGDAVIFTTNFRPVKGSKGYYRANMKHGVSAVKSGLRYTMGVIFHDAS